MKDVVAQAKAIGIEIKPNTVYSVRSDMRTKAKMKTQGATRKIAKTKEKSVKTKPKTIARVDYQIKTINGRRLVVVGDGGPPYWQDTGVNVSQEEHALLTEIEATDVRPHTQANGDANGKAHVNGKTTTMNDHAREMLLAAVAFVGVDEGIRILQDEKGRIVEKLLLLSSRRSESTLGTYEVSRSMPSLS